jgi:CP family cyanate transporter-like MFS transporter
MTSFTTPSRSLSIILAIGIFLTALNMRTTIIAIPPMMEIIRLDTGLSSTATGLIMTLPVICFALLSLTAPAVARRIGLDRAILGSMALLCIGIAIRVAPSIPLLFVGTAVIGAAIALGNVLVPAVIKRDFPHHPGLMTALYGMGMAGGGMLAAAIMVPIHEGTDLGWRGTLGVLLIPALVAVAALLPRLRLGGDDHAVAVRSGPVPRLWGDLLAWQIAMGMGLQSFVFYGLGTWSPTILVDNGLSESTAGVMWSICQAGAIPASFIAPFLFARGLNQRLLVTVITAMFTTSITGMLLAPAALPWLWMLLLGMSGSSSFAAVLIFIVQRSPDAAHAAALSGMSQAVGYSIAATSPFLFGALHDLTGGWTVPVVVVLGSMGPFLWAMLGASRHRLVGQPTQGGGEGKVRLAIRRA